MSARSNRSGFVLAACLVAFACTVNAQLIVSTQTNLQQLAQSITGPGVQISNPAITCHSQGYGEFIYSGSALSVTDGLILTTGRMTDAPGPNNNGGSNWFAQNTAGDPLLDAVTGRSTRDACKFEFDIIPSGDSLKFDFVFGSEEYNEWVGSQYNDVFGFFITGPGIVGDPGAGGAHNIALVPGTSTPVTINNVNNGSNSAFYHDNTGGTATQYDGYTIGLSAKTAVNPCTSYHLKLVVADATDRKYDSGVFIDRVESPTITMQSFTLNGGPDLIEGCNPGWVRFTRSQVTALPLNLQYYIQGTAINGTDYTAIAPINPALPKLITIPANQAYVDRPIDPVADAINEPTENLKFILGNPNCPGQNLDTLLFSLRDTMLATVTPVSAIICQGGSQQYTISGGTNFLWSPAASLNDPTSATPIASPASTTTYTVQVNDGVCSRTYNRLLRVSELALSAVLTNPLCNGNNNGSINLSHTGGYAPYTYSWTGPGGFTASTQDINGLVAGTYSVTVTDAACTRTQSFNLVAPGALTANLAPVILAFGQNIACFGGSTGSIDATVAGGTGPYVTTWTGPNGFTSNSVDLSGLPAGTYTLSVTDAHGCAVNASTTLTQSPALSVSAGISINILCVGVDLGAAVATVTGGTPPYSYSWNTPTPQTGQTAIGLTSGTYTVTVTDGYGCTATASVGIGLQLPLSIALTSQTGVACTGSGTGSATVTATGGTGPLLYVWGTLIPQFGQTAVNLTAGVYLATVIDGNGCIATVSVTISQPPSPLAASLFAQQNVLCRGNSNGSATVSASGGVGPYSYSWNTIPVQTSATATGLAAGVYTCTVTDVNSCSKTVNVTITQPAAVLSASIASSTNVLCRGNNTGSATVNVIGGTAPYTYNWNSAPAQISATMSTVPAGNYICTVTDSNGCTTTASITITQPAASLTANISGQTNVLCFGNTTGSATVSVSGGTVPYMYSWNTAPVQNTATVINLAVGTYLCTITDGNGCSTTASVTIAQPAAALSASISTQTNVACFGSSTGSATVNASGGAGAYGYSWNTVPVQNTATAFNMPAGTWTCTISDVNGCSTSAVAAIAQPASGLTASISAQTNVLCFGSSTGSASVLAAGGTGVYSYSWNTIPAQSSATATGLTAGTYTCTVTDAAGCSATAATIIAQPAAALSGTGVIVHAICNGVNDGSVDLTISGGTGPYVTSWTGPGGFTASTTDISAVFAGVYTVVITDANGCTWVNAFTVTEPSLYQVTVTPSSFIGGNNISCANNSDGSLSASASGGTPNYGYAWTGPNGFTSGNANISGLAAGTYTLVVTDGNGCQIGATTTLTAPPAFASAISSPDNGGGFNISCNGGSNGNIDATVAGGTAPVTYAWTGPGAFTAITEDITNLIAGNYALLATDANGCTTNTAMALVQPAAISISTVSSTNVDCNSGNTGAGQVSASGGVAPYSLSWNTVPVQNGPSVAALAAGTWTVTLLDANGCTATHDVAITEPAAALSASISATTNVLCFGNASGNATANASGGTGPYNYSWNTSPLQSSATAIGLGAGTWTCTVTDANGCTSIAAAVITEPTGALSASITSQQNVTCFGLTNGNATALATGGTGPYTYTWNTAPVQNGAALSNVGPGSWTVSATDANGCNTTALVTIIAPAVPLGVGLVSSINQSCFGSNNGQATVVANGGTAPYIYTWNTAPPQIGATASGLGSGTWTVSITDANGCSTSLGVVIGGPTAPLALSITSVTDVLCHGANTGAATVSASGGTAPYTYTWLNPPVNGPTITDLLAGTFTVVVVDANGCSASVNVTISEPATSIGIFVESFQNVSCFGGNDGYATVEATGGSGSYSIVWNTAPQQTGATATGLSAGLYTVTVTDNNGCDTPKDHPVVITQPAAALSIASATSIFGAFNISCHGNPDGWIDVSVSGGTAPYSYTWTDDFGATTGIEDLSTLVAGNYYLSVGDANGCSTNATFSLTEPAALGTSASITTAACQGSNDGAIDVSVSGGAVPYIYDWTGANGFTASTQDLSGLVAGVYTLTITDANGCSVTEAHDVNQPGLFSISAILSNFNGSGVSCQSSANGSIDASVSGGTLPYQLGWTGPNGFTASTEDISGLAAGTYNLTVTDGNGCGTFNSYTLTAPATLNVNAVAALIGGGTIGCNGAVDGSINATIVGGTPGYAIAWTGPNGFTANSEDINGLGAGSYTIAVTDLNGCNASAMVVLTQPTVLTNSVSVSQYNSGNAISCDASSNGSIDLSVLGGSAPYTIAWTGPNGFTASTQDIGGLAAGTYNVTITDANGCITAASPTLTAPSPLSLGSTVSSYIGGNAISCSNSTNGSINITVNGGAGNNTFQWTGSNAFTSTSEDLTGLEPGSYVVVVTDQNGCTTSASFNLTAPSPIAAVAAITTAACQGTNNGAIDLSATGGTAPFNFLWSGPGAYTSNTEDIDDLFAGVYTVLIADANGCTHSEAFDVNQPGLYTVSAIVSGYPGGFNTSCATANDGSIDLSVSGATSPYFYFWTGPNGFSAITEDIAGLAPGTYQVTITDQNGCSTFAPYSITSATPVGIGLAATVYSGGVNTTCAGTADGGIDATVTGGVAPYTIEWSGPNNYTSITEDITTLEPGNYNVLITDAVGCTASANITLTGPTPMSTTITTSIFGGGNGVSCNGTMDGAIDLEVSGGTLPRLIQWTGPNGFNSNNEDINAAAGGTYSVTITDANGCITTATVDLQEPAPINVVLDPSLYSGGFNIPCGGDTNGSISAVVNGGNGGFTYAWTGPNGFTSTDPIISGLAAGSYTLVVTDANGCTSMATLSLVAPQPLSVDELLSDVGNGYQVSCSGNDGSIDLTVTNGTAPYQFDWTGPSGYASLAEDISALGAGSYAITVVDANGCTNSNTVTLTAPGLMQATLAVSGNVCDGTDDGAIDLSLNGGTGPYTTTWTGPNGFSSSNEDITALAGGTYTVSVSDAGTCSGTWGATIAASQPYGFDLYVSDYGNFHIPCSGDSSGVIEVDLTGGAGPLNIVWTGPNGFTANNLTDLSGLVAGDYTVNIIDANGCALDSTITLTEPATAVGATLSAALFPSGTNVSCNGVSDGFIDLSVMGGTAPYLFDWRGPDSTIFSTEDISGLVAGTYELVVTDTNQCSFTTSIILTEPDSALLATATLSQFVGGYNTSCNGNSDGSIGVSVSGGNGGNAFSWTGPNNFTSTSDTLSGIGAGTYTLTVTDINGCLNTQNIAVTAPQPLDPVLAPFAYPSGSNTSCDGTSDGSINATVLGGVPTYILAWTGPNGFTSTNAAISGLAPGTYCLSVTDTNNCSMQECVDIVANTAMTSSTSSTNANCGSTAGGIDLTVTGGGAPYSFDWENGAQTEDIAGVIADTYSVTITDMNGCSIVDSATVAGSPAVAASANTSAVFCNGGNDGGIDLSVLAGTGPYNFDWSNGDDTEDLGGLIADDYTVTITDAMGCTWSNTYTVGESAALVVDSTIAVQGNGYNVSSYNGHDGGIALNVTGGNAPYTYEWNTGATTANVNGLAAGTYTVTITDANGCTLMLSFTLNQPTDLVMPTGFSPNGDGSNDAYVVQGLDGYPNNHMLVVNRWGNTVFDQLNYRNDWRGENQQGEALPNGTYFVVITINEGELTLQNYVDLRR
ncbi:MAG: choice-of-anchor L domain-containing protein [Flavobacteriales bacterium]